MHIPKQLLSFLGVFFTLSFLANCTAQHPRPKPYPSFHDSNGRPTLSVWGFTCEMGGKKCKDRQVGREMRELVVAEMSHLGKFRAAETELKEKKHMMDVSDMLWSSNEPDVLQDLIHRGDSDYLVFGRVLDYEKSTRFLWIELTLVQRESKDQLVVQGKGSSGSLPNAVKDAVSRLAPNLEPFMD